MCISEIHFALLEWRTLSSLSSLITYLLNFLITLFSLYQLSPNLTRRRKRFSQIANPRGYPDRQPRVFYDFFIFFLFSIFFSNFAWKLAIFNRVYSFLIASILFIPSLTFSPIQPSDKSSFGKNGSESKTSGYQFLTLLTLFLYLALIVSVDLASRFNSRSSIKLKYSNQLPLKILRVQSFVSNAGCWFL